jgi:enoyl-CoA hydratase/carnithine racemase
VSHPDDTIRTSTIEGLARITLDRPPVNVLTTAMMRELAAALRRVAADDAVRVIRLDASGKTFSAGVDVGEHLGDLLPSMMAALADLFVAFDSVPQPIVAVVQGAALGGGLEVVLGAISWSRPRGRPSASPRSSSASLLHRRPSSSPVGSAFRRRQACS